MAKKKITPRITPKALFIVVDTREHQGQDERPSDGGPYSGYGHTIIEIVHMGPVYFCEEGKGYGSHRFYRFDENVDWENLDKEKIFVIVSRYSDGGTFGRTEGYYGLEFASPDFEVANQWMKDHRDGIQAQHQGYFADFEGIDIHIVDFTKNHDTVQCRRW